MIFFLLLDKNGYFIGVVYIFMFIGDDSVVEFLLLNFLFFIIIVFFIFFIIGVFMLIIFVNGILGIFVGDCFF